MNARKSPIEVAQQWREEGVKVVFTNGCFDLLHPGHITYLKEAKQLGDRLIVGLNSDQSVKILKGQDRPIFNLAERTIMLESLLSVDLVIPFEEDNPLRLIEEIKPKILVKGGDYKLDNIIGAKFVRSNGGQVKTLRFVEGFSTSEIIRRIKDIKAC